MTGEIHTTRRGGLLRDPDFRRLWTADALSQLGSRISVLAVPLLAITTLNASAFEVSLLRTLAMLPYLLLVLQAGAWCDRIRTLPVLIGADLARAVIFGSVPLAATFGVLTIWWLLAAVLVAGLFNVFFDVGYPTYLPRLLKREDVLEGNARLQTNMSVAAVAGPSAAGFLIQAFGGPVAILANALSFLWSGLWLRRIQTPEPRPEPAVRKDLRREIGEGLRLVWRHPVLRALAGGGAMAGIFQSVQMSITVVFLSREVHLSPGSIGLLSTTTLLGALIGSMSARRLGARFGQARTLLSATLLCGVSYLLFPLTGRGAALAFYVVAGLSASFTIMVMNVLSVSFRQLLTPAPLLGRMNATLLFLQYGAIPVGSLLGGVLATTVGLRATLWVGGIGMLGPAAWLLFSPVRTLRDLPEPEGVSA